jgi:acyl-coenzyme A synthetase/AMP-(fatty) acid ligase
MLESVDFLGAVSCSGKAYHVPGLVFSDVYHEDTEDGSSEGADGCGPYTGGETDRAVRSIIERTCSFDPLYGVFTSGTTGVPKLVVKSHASMISFIEDFTEMFDIDENEVLGNQFPFYFDASTKDLYCCLKCGLTVHIIPKQFFSFPQLLLNYLIENRITTIIWVPSALSLVANGDGLETIGVPQTVSKVFFVGEQMPVRQLNYWKNHLPDTEFINIYGATETAGNFLYFIYDKMLADDARLPAGRPFPDAKVFLLKEDGSMVQGTEETGEICVVSSTLSQGYYGNPQMTGQVFVQNPFAAYREIMYRTGDLARYDRDGNIVWVSRRDFQIKHMGYRIELSEIETALGALADIDECCCIYNEEKQKIFFYYQAEKDLKKEIGKQVREKLPKYMFPSKYIRLDAMPHNANGKIDRKKLALLEN